MKSTPRGCPAVVVATSAIRHCNRVITVLITVNPLPVVTFNWYSMVAIGELNLSSLGYVVINNATLLCIQQGSELLLSETPSGGVYTGTGISHDSIISWAT